MVQLRELKKKHDVEGSCIRRNDAGGSVNGMVIWWRWRWLAGSDDGGTF